MFTIFGFYKFQKINNLKKNQKILNKFLVNKNIYGSIIVSEEGLNGSISGKNYDIKNSIIKFVSRNNINNRVIFVFNFWNIILDSYIIGTI